MNAFRNFFVLACLAAIVFAFLYAARPEWFAGLVASQTKNAGEVEFRKLTLVIPAHGKGMPRGPEGVDVRQIVDFDDEGLPSRVNPYILVVNTADRTLRHFRLSPNVKMVNLKNESSQVVLKKSQVIDPNAPVQVEIWIPQAREIVLEVEIQVPKR